MPSVAVECRKAIANASDYQTWHDAAQELDRWEGMETWREEESSPDYDYLLIRERLQLLRKLRQNNEIGKLTYYLRQGMHWNLGNINNPALYSYSRVGTKYLIHDYLNELASILVYLCDTEFAEFPLAEKHKFFHDVALSFGRSGLMLSGGATMGFFHVGVVKALRDQNLLPRVISGSSAGAMVAGAVGTVKYEELDSRYTPDAFSHPFWKILTLPHAIRRGVLMDETQLRHAFSHILPDMTFAEAFEHSGRTINITVSPALSNQLPRLLNYLTFPHLYIRDAVLASCAVPFVFPPVMLMTREPDGTKVPFMPTQKWVDGSMKSDLPILRLRRLHNVNHTIVSQTNPLVLPFMQFQKSRRENIASGTREVGMRIMASQLRQGVDLTRRIMPAGRVRKRLDGIHALLEQDYRGNITILPRFNLINYLRIAANPTPQEIADYVLDGERSTWPKLALIRNSTVISRTLDTCLTRLNIGNVDRHTQKRAQLRLVR